MNTKTRVLTALTLLLVTLLLAGSCGLGLSSSEDAVDGRTGAAVPSDRGEAKAVAPGGAAGDQADNQADSSTGSSTGSRAERESGGAAGQASAVTPMTRSVISTGELTMHARDLTRARAEIIRLVTAWGGVVADEQSTSDRRGRLRDTTMTLRVPSSRFGEALRVFGTLGEVEHQSRSSRDVTTQVIDVAARVRAAERSIRQLERLLDRATQLGDIITLENELARRQADLDSLKAQQAWLADQTSLSTVNVYLSRPEHPGAGKREARGFLAGLEDGWRALRATTVVVLTGLGAALPFLVLLALLGIPLWLVVRRRRAPAPPPLPDTP